MALHRFRVRAGSKTWNDPGPDLLRPVENAQEQLRTLLRPFDGQKLQYRVDDGPWLDPRSKREILTVMGEGQYTSLRVARGDVIVAAVRHEEVEKLPVSNCSVGVSVQWSLLKHQFPAIVFAGGYVYKETFPGYWSDHAYGDAFDGTHKPPTVVNDDVFDWLVRMARSGCIRFSYVLGSRNGNVVSASAPDYEVVPSNASDSHTWHCHVSVIDHDGEKP